MVELNYHHLRLFRAVAHEGHLTRASEKLGLQPQTVSAQIRSLEVALNEQLFERSGRRLVLTDIGHLVLRHADDIFATIRGSGPMGQANAMLLGIARALVKIDPEFHQSLKDAGFLTRDSRQVERKKYGRRGARAGYQFSKR